MVADLMALIRESTRTQKCIAGGNATALEKPEGARENSSVGPKTHETPLPAPEALQQLVDVVTKLSDMDKCIEQARAMVPEDGEARKWHLISLTALEWTRKAHSEHVQVLLEKVKASAAGQRSPAGMGPPLTPACDAEPARVPLGTTEQMQCPPGLPRPEAAALVAAQPKLGCLRTDLEKLRCHDPDCCFIVRRIKHLGIDSASILEEHFARAGRVAAVYVSHSFEKPCHKRRNGRVRPAALGFVVMATRVGAERALVAGSEQLVGKAYISVQIFEPFEDLEQ